MTTVSEAKWFLALSEREQQEIIFARLYFYQYNHGTSGHLAYALIAKLSTALFERDDDPKEPDDGEQASG